MAKQIFINLPVSDLTASTIFYEALGFVKNTDFSDDKKGNALVWSESIIVMLLSKDFYKTFLRGKTIIDSNTSSGVLLAISVDTKEEVQKFADSAKENGGDFFRVESSGAPEDMMFSLEVSDPDGNTWEPVWMNPDFKPHN